jgi:hypothetical protein
VHAGLQPHGLLDIDGNRVITKSEYLAHGMSLAVGTAVNLCLGGDLLILGMSLDDVYLRDAILLHRRWIRDVSIKSARTYVGAIEAIIGKGGRSLVEGRRHVESPLPPEDSETPREALEIRVASSGIGASSGVSAPRPSS